MSKVNVSFLLQDLKLQRIFQKYLVALSPVSNIIFYYFQLYSLDISGPLLPGSLYDLCQLLKVSQEGNFTATLSAYQPSVALNVPLRKKESGFKPIVRESYTESSVSSLQLAHYQQPQSLEKVCLKELKCKGGLFTWTL